MTINHDILKTPIFSLSEADDVEALTLCRGSLITGSSGSGKSTTVGRLMARGLLGMRPKAAGYVVTAKKSETANWIARAKEAGRSDDLIIFNAESGHRFDPLHYEFSRAGRGAGDIESIVDLFSTLVSIGKKEVGHGHDPFWERGCEQLIRNCIKLLELAGEPISIASIDRVIKSLPTRPNEHEDPAWQNHSFCAHLTNVIRARKETLTPEQWSDLDVTTQYIYRKWPAFDERPRSSLEMTWSGMADKFLFSPLNRLFCSGACTFTPEQTTLEGKIVICDFPLLEYGHETGRLCNIILKLIYQRAWLRRNLEESPNLAFLWQDEFQYFITRRDNFFQQTCRESRVAVVCLTQNILNLSEELGEEQPGSKTKSFLGNLSGLNIFLQQNEMESCKFAADLIGREYRYLDSFQAGSDAARSHASVGGSQQLVHLVEPIEFTRLKTPDSSNPYSQGICYQSGKTFNATKTERNPKGRNYLSVLFSRE